MPKTKYMKPVDQAALLAAGGDREAAKTYLPELYEIFERHYCQSRNQAHLLIAISAVRELIFVHEGDEKLAKAQKQVQHLLHQMHGIMGERADADAFDDDDDDE